MESSVSGARASGLTRRAVLTGAVSLLPARGASGRARGPAATAQATVLTFEDLGLAQGSERPLNTAYGGFIWTQTGVLRSSSGRGPLGYRPVSGSGGEPARPHPGRW